MSRFTVLQVLNWFRSGAVPGILRDIAPHLDPEFTFRVVSLQSLDPADPVADQFKHSGIPVDSLNTSRVDLIRGWWMLRRYLAQTKPNLVHSHLGRSNLLAALTAKADTPVISTLHNVREGYHPLTRALYRLTDHRISARSCVSEHVAQTWYGNAEVRPRALRVIYNPIDLERMAQPASATAIRQELEIGDDTHLMLSVGRLVPQKGHATLLDAVHRARLDHDNFKLVILGRGPERARLERQIRGLDLARVVVMPGFRNDVPEFLHAADSFVLPSNWEGLGIALMEAMAAGTPVAATACPAIEEYVCDGSNGLLSPPGDAEALARNIERLIGCKEMREAMARRAQDTVRSRFDAGLVARQYAALYRSVLDGRSSDHPL